VNTKKFVRRAKEWRWMETPRRWA